MRCNQVQVCTVQVKNLVCWVELLQETIPQRIFEGGEGGVLSWIVLQAIPILDGSWKEGVVVDICAWLNLDVSGRVAPCLRRRLRHVVATGYVD